MISDQDIKYTKKHIKELLEDREAMLKDIEVMKKIISSQITIYCNNCGAPIYINLTK